jgi:hypothetical protein
MPCFVVARIAERFFNYIKGVFLRPFPHSYSVHYEHAISRHVIYLHLFDMVKDEERAQKSFQPMFEGAIAVTIREYEQQQEKAAREKEELEKAILSQALREKKLSQAQDRKLDSIGIELVVMNKA